MTSARHCKSSDIRTGAIVEQTNGKADQIHRHWAFKTNKVCLPAVIVSKPSAEENNHKKMEVTKKKKTFLLNVGALCIFKEWKL